MFGDESLGNLGIPDDENEFVTMPVSPYKLFSKWCSEARTSTKHKRDEMWLYGGPSGKRYVQLHGFDYRGFTWFDKNNEVNEMNFTSDLAFTWGCMDCVSR